MSENGSQKVIVPYLLMEALNWGMGGGADSVNDTGTYLLSKGVKNLHPTFRVGQN
jgi:hypothetical protein